MGPESRDSEIMGSGVRVQVIKITFLLRSALSIYVIFPPKSGNRYRD